VATVSGGTTSERFGFIHRYRKELGVVFLCRWLKVSRSGYYAWGERGASKRVKEDGCLLKVISRIFYQSQGRYGSPRVFKALQSQGLAVSRKRVERLMRAANLKGRVVRVTRRQPGLKRFKAKGENHLLRTGNATEMNKVWVADITYLKVPELIHLAVGFRILGLKVQINFLEFIGEKTLV